MSSVAPVSNNPVLRESQVAHLLERVADTIDITPTEYERAKTSYETISEVVTSSADPRLATAKVFPQGSFAIGTVIRPVDKDDGEIDVDLACRLNATTALHPSEAKKLIGDRLSNDARYSSILKEKSRCWRINYAGSFHLDICPLVTATQSDAIPDKELAKWILTHPEAFAAWFNKLAERSFKRSLTEDSIIKAEVAPFPDDRPDKGWLRRVVQLLKRDRDKWCQHAGPHAEFAPISIIITTLAAKAFERELSAGHRNLSSYDLIERIMIGMRDGIEQRATPYGTQWWVASPVADENFANRWNEDPRWSKAFTAWHQDALTNLHRLTSVNGLDNAKLILEHSYGTSASTKAINSYAEDTLNARNNGALRYVVTAGGLTTTAGSSAGIVVPKHTFYGG